MKCFEPGHVRQKCPVKFCRAMLHVTETCPGLAYAQLAGGAGSQLETLPMHEVEEDNDFPESTSAEAQQAPVTPGQAAACSAQDKQVTMATEMSAADSAVQAQWQTLFANQSTTAAAVCLVSNARAGTPTHSTVNDKSTNAEKPMITHPASPVTRIRGRTRTVLRPRARRPSRWMARKQQ